MWVFKSLLLYSNTVWSFPACSPVFLFTESLHIPQTERQFYSSRTVLYLTAKAENLPNSSNRNTNFFFISFSVFLNNWNTVSLSYTPDKKTCRKHSLCSCICKLHRNKVLGLFFCSFYSEILGCCRATNVIYSKTLHVSFRSWFNSIFTC